ncbi:beta-lactamase domain protein [Halodesulfurarchaeum formicicum]|uniref:Beta-lactamase domain protein n=1 Tax=Halodesulfurarchaeum formicicum TaxID=1873524 RepID=A0A1D8S567_9EURY|nr:MBL fold metallo-hydrolase [Halodesulfurarchaeum formicicum]AOW80485.1 beta-lactamase domain protein [Halodesulfurarchaeum formicicum]
MAIHSDWGDWLPEAVAAANPDGLALWYLGCNGFILKAGDGTTLFIDPYLGTGDPPRTVRMIPIPFEPADVQAADAVLATHEHTDHVHGPSQAPILTETGATFLAPEQSVRKAREEETWTETYGVEPDQYDIVSTGESREFGAVTVHVEPAFDPDAAEPVSYLIEYDGLTVFHGGDTKPDPALEKIGREYDIDLGILAFGSTGMIPDKTTREPKKTTWYSDETQVIDAAEQLSLDRLLPTHWDMWKGLTADPTALFDHRRSRQAPARIDIVEIGDRVDLQ